jgi:single-stranded-DNA-specific exonuclease
MLNKSILGFTWRQKTFSEQSVYELVTYGNIDEMTSRLLALRGVNIKNVDNYLDPKIKNNMPSPFVLKDMETAALEFIKAIHSNKKICIFGDFDVDGATSSSLIVNFLQKIGYKNYIKYIPDRFKEGYGIHESSVDILHKNNVEFIVTVDLGSSAIEAALKAKLYNITLIVLDHHLAAVLADAKAIVNPNRIDDKSNLGFLAAVGVTYMFLCAVLQLEPKFKIFNIIEFLDLVALGTVCDMVPIIDLNRAFVHQGIKVMEKRLNIGIKELLDISSVNSKISTYHLGFLLGPRINAASRIGTSSYGSDLLCTKIEKDAKSLSIKLNTLNEERKKIELSANLEALKMAETLSNKNSIFLYNKDWHTGVIGIIAGRIKEKFNKPSCIMSNEDGKIKASLRSIPNINIGSLIIKAKELGLVENGGGHAMAGGFTASSSNKIPEICVFFEEEITKIFQNLFDRNNREYDTQISPYAVNKDLLDKIKQLEPFGMGAKEPIFYIEGLFVLKATLINNLHLSLIFGIDKTHNLNRSKTLLGMYFNAANTDLCSAFLSETPNKFGVFFYLKENIKGQPQLHIIDGKLL